MFKNIDKINFTAMTDVALAKWLRDNYKSGRSYELNLMQSLEIARALRIVYNLGEIRGKSINI